MPRFLDWVRRPHAEQVPPFPEQWRAVLTARSAHYRHLPGDVRPAFERGVQEFIGSHRITGVEMEVDDEQRLLVAASAVTLSVGWRGYQWKEVAEVLLYPDYFDEEYTIGPREIAGQAHVWGTVIISVPALRDSFARADDGYHVGLHEFAHLLAYERGGRTGGIPRGLRTAEMERWVRIQKRELAKVRQGRSIVVMLGQVTVDEFFPCAVEAFFEMPLALKDGHASLHKFLTEYFGQDPAGW